MVNNTVNGKKIGNAAGYKDATRILAEGIYQKNRDKKELGVQTNISIPTISLIQTGEFVSIKAYPGGNPNKVQTNKREEDLTH